MEQEVRFYFASQRLSPLRKLLGQQGLDQGKRAHEVTLQYDHCDPHRSFYSKEVDGRLRVRTSTTDTRCICLLSWKQRTPLTFSGQINQEIEEEVHIDGSDIDHLRFILEQVFQFPLVESYERYRTIFSDASVEIALDEYPFGVALEVESKAQEYAEEIISNWVAKLGLHLDDAYRLSWDDMYKELCASQGVPCFSHVRFGKPMPQVP